MKNISRLLIAAMALVSASSMAALMQPAKPVREDAPFRVSTGIKGGIAKNAAGTGMNSLGLGLGFTHNVGYDIEYGLSISGDYAGLMGARIFGGEKAESDSAGIRTDAELMLRFMPEVAERFNLGAQVGLGWGMQFGEEAKKLREGLGVKFGDLSFRAGIALSYGFTDMFYMYFAPSYIMTGIRFYEEGKKEASKDITNVSGVELPLGVFIPASENVAFFVEANTKLMDWSKIGDTWREDITLGVSFGI